MGSLGLLCAVVSPVAASAQSEEYNGASLGVSMGDPTGATFRVGFGEAHALQAAVGFSPFPGDAFVAMLDWTYDGWDFMSESPKLSLIFYLGAGAKLERFLGSYYVWWGTAQPNGRYHRSDGDWTHRQLGVGTRGLLGLRAPFREVPFDLFFEVAPVGFIYLTETQRVSYDIDIAVGGRFRF